jgi:hypothetical protein
MLLTHPALILALDLRFQRSLALLYPPLVLPNQLVLRCLRGLLQAPAVRGLSVGERCIVLLPQGSQGSVHLQLVLALQAQGGSVLLSLQSHRETAALFLRSPPHLCSRILLQASQRRRHSRLPLHPQFLLLRSKRRCLVLLPSGRHVLKQRLRGSAEVGFGSLQGGVCCGGDSRFGLL